MVIEISTCPVCGREYVDNPACPHEGHKLITRAEAAALLGVSVRTVDRLCQRGRLERFRRTGKRATLVPASSVAQLRIVPGAQKGPPTTGG